MIAALTAMAAALAVGLPIFALGERIRERGERHFPDPRIEAIRKDIP